MTLRLLKILSRLSTTPKPQTHKKYSINNVIIETYEGKTLLAGNFHSIMCPSVENPIAFIWGDAKGTTRITLTPWGIIDEKITKENNLSQVFLTSNKEKINV